MLTLKILALIFFVMPASLVVVGFAFLARAMLVSTTLLMLVEREWTFGAISAMGCLLVIGVLAALGWLVFTHYWLGAVVLVGAAVVTILLLDHIAKLYIQAGTRLGRF